MNRGRRLQDQILVLDAIVDVRAELKAAGEKPSNFRETLDVSMRLLQLYSLLDAGRLKELVSVADTREAWKEENDRRNKT
jgi:hypothetical protein